MFFGKVVSELVPESRMELPQQMAFATQRSPELAQKQERE